MSLLNHVIGFVSSEDLKEKRNLIRTVIFYLEQRGVDPTDCALQAGLSTSDTGQLGNGDLTALAEQLALQYPDFVRQALIRTPKAELIFSHYLRPLDSQNIVRNHQLSR